MQFGQRPIVESDRRPGLSVPSGRQAPSTLDLKVIMFEPTDFSLGRFGIVAFLAQAPQATL
ncbi:MAG TPA: hypothetical protein PLJ16_14065 [Casimicrobium huifangae]|nr:hypothetical protein [Casimicrobium huifangae]